MKKLIVCVAGCVFLSVGVFNADAQSAAAAPVKYTAEDIKEYIRATEAELERRGNQQSL